MLDPITIRVIQILATDQDVFVPLRRLYKDLSNEGLLTHMDEETFEQFLRANTQFEFIEDLEDRLFGEVIDPETNAELEAVGFFSGLRIKLRARKITDLVMIYTLLKQLQRMNESLESVWRLRADNPHMSDSLLHVLMMGDMLERQVRELLLGELIFQEQHLGQSLLRNDWND